MTVDLTLHNAPGDFSDRHGLYLIVAQGTIAGQGFYFGLQTDVNLRGKGAIFSRWGERDLSFTRTAERGWTESSGHEGDFIGVRRSYDWVAGSYRMRLALDGADDDGHWYGLWITDLATDSTTWLGSLKFPLVDGSAIIEPMVATAIESYGSRIRPIDSPLWHISMSRPIGDGAVAGWIYPGYGDFLNSDYQYDATAVHFRVGSATERVSTLSGEWIQLPSATPVPTATPTSSFVPLSPEEIRELLKRIKGKPGLGGKRTTPDGTTIISTIDEMFTIFETGHYLVTGEPSGWIPVVLTREDYDQRARERGVQGRSLGYCCDRTDEGLELVMKGSEPADRVLAVIAHEAGHARQRTVNPDQGGQGYGWALREAQAFAFDGAFVRLLGAYAGVNARVMPTQYNLQQWIESWITRLKEALEDPDQGHARGEAILWGAILSDPALADLREELVANQMLSGESLFKLHDYLVGIEPDAVDAYVETMLSAFSEETRFIRNTVMGRAGAISDEGFFEHNHRTFTYP